MKTKLNKYISIFSLLFFLFTITNIQGQSKIATEKLNFINSQFKAHNAYGVHFWIDIKAKALKSESTYFIITYPMNEVSSFSYSSGIIKFECGSGKCLNSYDKDIKSNDSKSEFTVNLDVNESTGNQVRDAFYDLQTELKKEWNGKTTTVNNSKDFSNNQNLIYINKQFAAYNPYNVHFWIDAKEKALMQESTYFIVTYPINEIGTFSFNKKIIKLECSNDKCISSLDKDDKKITPKSENTINLDCEESIGSSVVQALYDLQSELRSAWGLKKVTKTNNYNNSLTTKEDHLNYINSQFKLYNQYDVHFWFDANEQALKSESKYFILTYPINKISTFVFSSGVLTLNCSSNECITSYDKDSKTSNSKSSFGVNLDCDAAIADKVVESFYELQKILQSEWYGKKVVNNISNNVTNSGNTNLDYINEQFKAHNAYDVHFWIDQESGSLKSESKYFIVTYPFMEVKSFDFNSNVITITCSSGDCISSFDKDYSTTKKQESFTVNLDVDNEVGQKVAQAFLDLQLDYLLEDISNNLQDVNNNNNNNILDPQSKQNLDYINKEFKKNNAYDVHFWFEDSKTLKSKSIYFELSYPIAEIEKVVYENQTIEFKCTSGSCITCVDNESGAKTYKDSFAVNYTSDENGNLIARNFNAIIAILKK
ncbi:MAG: hypothetical protein HXX09_06060 [Bacteroidetes bacterium]|nr:hypothetical protein [Bacteroidota bacterium]